MQQTYKFLTESQMQDFAKNLVHALTSPKTLILNGDLGTGKTTFARAFIQELVGHKTIVPSPTFTILQTYKKDNITINHLDLYRLTDKEELIELDLQSLFSSDFTLIEWPDLAKPFLPKDATELKFFIENEIHHISIVS